MNTPILFNIFRDHEVISFEDCLEDYQEEIKETTNEIVVRAKRMMEFDYQFCKLQAVEKRIFPSRQSLQNVVISLKMIVVFITELSFWSGHFFFF